MNDVRDEAWERRLDAGLAENERGVRPPDVTAAVLTRVAAGDRGGELQALPPARRESRWLAAAVLLLGIGVVAGVWALRRSGDDAREQPAQGTAAARDWRTVSTRAEIDALPPDVKFVDGRELTDDDVAALTRCAQLEGLRLRAWPFDPNKLHCPLLTAKALPQLRALSKLRVLELDGQLDLLGAPLDVLADLPLLQELGLIRFDTEDAALAVVERMPSLRSLDLTLNHGFRGDSLQRIGKLPGLQTLRLLGCSQLSVAMLAPILGLGRLEELDLSGIGWGWRAHGQGDSSVDGARRLTQQQQAKADGAGLTPAIVELLPTGLRRLGLSETGLDDNAIHGVTARVRGLEALDLSWSQQITDAAVTHALSLPRLRKLDLSRSPLLTAGCIDALAQARQLREVVLRDLPWLTIGHVRRLLAVDIRVDGLGAQLAQDLSTFAVVRSIADVQALDPQTGAVDALDLDAEGIAALLRLRGLERLRLRYGAQAEGDGESVTPHTDARNLRSLGDADLAKLADLPGLQALELLGTVNVRGDGIRALVRLPKLALLRLACFDVADDTLAILPKFPALRALRLEACLGFGSLGMHAIDLCTFLEDVRIAHCPQLLGRDLAELGGMRNLKTLVLRGLATVRNDQGRQLRNDERDNRAAALAAVADPEAGYTGRLIVSGTQPIHLEISWGHIDRTSVGNLRNQQVLDLSGNDTLESAWLRDLPDSLRTLRLGHCPRLDDDVATLLRDHLPALEELAVFDNPQLTDAFVETVLQIPSLRSLNLAQCTGLTAHAGELLLAAKGLTELELTGSSIVNKPLIDQLTARGTRVRYTSW